MQFVPGGYWSTVAHIHNNGTLKSTGTRVQETATDLKCSQCKITIGALFAIAGRDADYKDTMTYNAVQVAIMRIAAGQHLRFPNGTDMGPILPGVDIKLIHGDTSATRSIPTSLKPVKTDELESVIKNITVNYSPVGFLGLGFSSEALRSERILQESQKVVISHSATNPGLTSHPWFARTVPHDAVQGLVMAQLLLKLNVRADTEIIVVFCDDSYCEKQFNVIC